MRMKRFLGLCVMWGVLALVAASVAAATVGYDTSRNAWFIGRGDVIAAAGKDALSPPSGYIGVASFYDDTLRCTYSDGTQTTPVFHDVLGSIFTAEPRYAPGNNNITGYFSGALIFQDYLSNASCPFSLTGHGTLTATTFVSSVLTSEVVSFNGTKVATLSP